MKSLIQQSISGNEKSYSQEAEMINYTEKANKKRKVINKMAKNGGKW